MHAEHRIDRPRCPVVASLVVLLALLLLRLILVVDLRVRRGVHLGGLPLQGGAAAKLPDRHGREP
eukprot:5262125-Alexandrium_andersonii.AAC.1